MPEKHFHRRSIRLEGYDYRASGAYFVTICTHQRECMFGSIVDDSFSPTVYADVAYEVWDGLPAHYANVELDAFVVMPNHSHGVILLTDAVGRVSNPPLHPRIAPPYPKSCARSKRSQRVE